MNYAQQLWKLMELRGYSMYRLAKEMPCSQTAVKKWLMGSTPNPVMRARITEILGELPEETESPASAEASGVSVNPHYYELSDSERAAVDALIDHYATRHQSDD